MKPTTPAEPTNADPPPPPGQPAALGEHPGDSIGPYRLLSLLGEGGFGTVWLAERREPFVQRVALKIIKAGMDTKAVIARFEQERQALAVMDHPNVAKVYDAGMTPTGRPYFVMEQVQGEPITDFCDRHTYTTRQRLALFIPVCEAVQHAHMKGIIHRDLKPSNILVTLKDGHGVPKVIDFGVAKAISHTLTDKTIFTETGQLIGTPEYMSPEQAEMGRLDVDTRTDVYSLGVVLYELLTGLLPFDAATLRSKGYDEIRRIIREVDPPTPSKRLTTIAVGAGSKPGVSATGPERPDAPTESVATRIARTHATPVADLARALHRELEWVPLKALRKDRTQRYSSPEALGSDVRRFLEGLALDAGPVSAAYRARKFVRRHRGSVLAGAAVLLALTVALATTLGMLRGAARTIRAETDAAKSKSVTKFLADMLSNSELTESGPNPKLNDVLDAAVRALNSRPETSNPEVDAAARMVIANIYLSAREGALARPLLTAALRLRQQAHSAGGVQDAEIAETMNDLALAMHLDAVRQPQSGQSLFDEADKLYAESLAIRRRVFGSNSKEVADSLNNMAGMKQSQKRFDEAEKLHREALAVRRHLYVADSKEIAQSMNNLALVLKEQGIADGNKSKLDEAESLYRDSAEMRMRVLGPSHPQVATSLNNLATLLRERKRPAEAEPYQRQALEIRKARLPPGHLDTLLTQSSLGLILVDQEKGAEAETLLRESLEAFTKLNPPSPTMVAMTKSAIGAALTCQSKFEEAESLVLEAYEEVHDSPRIAWVGKKIMIERIVRLYERWGKDDKAREWKAKLETPGD